MRSITKLDLQYAHRFYGFKGEAQYLHGHTGVLTIEVEDSVEPGVNMVFPCNEIQKTAWEVLKNFDHALVLREDDPLLPAILGVYEAQGIKDGAPTNKMKGPAFKTELATAYPDCRLVVTKANPLFLEGLCQLTEHQTGNLIKRFLFQRTEYNNLIHTAQEFRAQDFRKGFERLFFCYFLSALIETNHAIFIV